jgi:hypothetical protein
MYWLLIDSMLYHVNQMCGFEALDNADRRTLYQANFDHVR